MQPFSACASALSILLILPIMGQAQPSMTPAQQCEQYKHELTLADIAHQEARARAGNIMRQAYALEAEVQRLKEENTQLQAEVARFHGEKTRATTD